MLTRRVFASCAMCAAVGLVATGVDDEARAQTTAPPAFQRFPLQQMDGPAEGYMTVLMRIEIAPGGLVARHTHFGIETSFALEGSGTLSVQGRPDLVVKPGGSFQVPAGVVHSLQGGDAPMKILASFVVEKGKPLATPAP